MRKNEVSGKQELLSRIKTTVIMSGATVAASVLLLLLLSVLIQNEALPPNAGRVCAVGAVIALAFAFSLAAVKANSGKTLISGLSVAAGVIIILFLGSLFFSGGPQPSIVTIAGVAAAGAGAGLLGGKRKKIR